MKITDLNILWLSGFFLPGVASALGSIQGRKHHSSKPVILQNALAASVSVHILFIVPPLCCYQTCQCPTLTSIKHPDQVPVASYGTLNKRIKQIYMGINIKLWETQSRLMSITNMERISCTMQLISSWIVGHLYQNSFTQDRKFYFGCILLLEQFLIT